MILGLGLRQLVDPLLQELLIGAQIGELVSARAGKTRQQRDHRGRPADRRHVADIPLSGHCSPREIKGCGQLGR